MFWMEYVVVALATMLLVIAEEKVADPPFHLMPLGSHLAPAAIDEVNNDNMVTPSLFAKGYMLPRKSLLLRGAAKQWPALTKWTDGYLHKGYGELEVKLDSTRRDAGVPPPQGDVCLGRDTLAHFINTYRQKDATKYVWSELPTPLYTYVNLPSPLACGELSRSIVEVDMMLDSAGVQSKLSKDYFDIMMCVVNGTQDWKLIESKHEELIYQELQTDERRSNQHHSLVNPVQVDMKSFPNVAHIPQMYAATLNAGDCLYLPSQTWHTVHSTADTNAAVSFLFKHLEGDVNLGNCANENIALPLTQVDPDWKYSGRGRMSMGNSAISYYVSIMDSFFGKTDETLKYDHVYNTLIDMMANVPYSEIHVDERAKDLYEKLDALSGKGAYTLSMLAKLSRKKLRKLINNYMEPPNLPNSYHHEYSIFPPEKVMELFKAVSLDDGVVHKKKFIDAYVKMGGHVKVAKAVWKRYAGGKQHVKYRKQESRMMPSVEKFYLYWAGESYNAENLYGEDSDEEEESEDGDGDDGDEGEDEGDGEGGDEGDGEAVDTREGESGDTREGESGDTREGEAGDTREGEAGDTREGEAGDGREGEIGTEGREKEKEGAPVYVSPENLPKEEL